MIFYKYFLNYIFKDVDLEFGKFNYWSGVYEDIGFF